MSMPMVATAVPKMPPTFVPAASSMPACAPSQWLASRAMPMVMAVTAVVSKPTAMPEMMLVAGPVLRGLGDLLAPGARCRRCSTA